MICPFCAAHLKPSEHCPCDTAVRVRNHTKRAEFLNVGDKVTTGFIPGEAAVIRKIINLRRGQTSETKTTVLLDAGPLCPCCNTLVGSNINTYIDSGWIAKVIKTQETGL